MANDSNQAPADVIGFLDFYFVKKAPIQIPDTGREVFVHYAPWITVVLLVLMLPPLLLVLRHGTLFARFTGAMYGFTYVTFLLIVEIGLMVAALPGLLARKMSGWTLMFGARIVGFVSSFLAGAFDGPLVVLIIFTYVFLQVRRFYEA